MLISFSFSPFSIFKHLTYLIGSQASGSAKTPEKDKPQLTKPFENHTLSLHPSPLRVHVANESAGGNGIQRFVEAPSSSRTPHMRRGSLCLGFGRGELGGRVQSRCAPAIMLLMRVIRAPPAATHGLRGGETRRGEMEQARLATVPRPSHHTRINESGLRRECYR